MRSNPLRSDPARVRAWQQRSRSGLRRTPLVAARKAIPQRSPRKRERWVAVAEASVAALTRDGYRCQAAGLAPGDCWGPLEPHHVIGRRAAPELVAVERNILAACHSHHAWITDHPTASRAVGLSGRSGDDLAELARIRAESAPDRSLRASERFPR
jgi:hypothetical protein